MILLLALFKSSAQFIFHSILISSSTGFPQPTLSQSLFFPKTSLNQNKMNKLSLILSKCRSLSRHLGRSSSYNSLRSKFVKDDSWKVHDMQEDEQCETVLVGSTRKQYLISSKYLNNPLLKALINKSNQEGNDKSTLIINCEVVLFDHLLWMLENADPMFGSDSLEELAELYVF